MRSTALALFRAEIEYDDRVRSSCHKRHRGRRQRRRRRRRQRRRFAAVPAADGAARGEMLAPDDDPGGFGRLARVHHGTVAPTGARVVAVFGFDDRLGLCSGLIASERWLGCGVRRVIADPVDTLVVLPPEEPRSRIDRQHFKLLELGTAQLTARPFIVRDAYQSVILRQHRME